MDNHFHVSFLAFVISACYTIILLFGWRMLAGIWADTKVGQAMAAIYS